MSLTRDFARLLLTRAAAAREPAAQEMAARLLLDGVAVAALGSTQRGPRILAALAAEAGAAAQATVIGQRQRLPAAEAARVNGAAMHVLDYEPMWNPANHALSTTLPALLALAEMLGQAGAAPAGPAAAAPPQPDGATLLAALVLGVEAQERMRLASGQLEPGGLLFHPPGAVGAFGSATACGHLLGLDEQALTHALGIAASGAAGIQGNIGSMTKALHCGQAAQAGLEAALLAARGFTADQDALGGPRGYGKAFYGAGFNATALLAPHPWYIVDPGPAFKFYPSQYGTHFVITAALAARRQLWSGRLDAARAAGIAAVEIVVPPMPYVDRPLPVTGLDGKFSFQYVAALALLDDGIDVPSFTDARLAGADTARAKALDGLDVWATLAEGKASPRTEVVYGVEPFRSALRVGDWKLVCWGKPADPALLEGKAIDCLSGVFSADHAAVIARQARDFAGLDGAAVRGFLDLLGPAAQFRS